MNTALRATRVSKSYGGKRALDGVDLAVEEGSIFGFLGPNGAGKTTMLRLITGLARPTSGTIEVLGHDVATAGKAVRAAIGFLPDVPAFYEWMTAPEFLRFAGELFGLERTFLSERIELLLGLAELTDVGTRIGGYSRGMKQKLGVAQALIGSPGLLLLDEPTSALDPMGRRDLLELIASLRGRTTVFFSTHILGDVERVCDTVAILDRGRLVTQAPITELKRRYATQKVVLEVTDGADAISAALAAADWVKSVARDPGGAIEVVVTDLGVAQHDIPALVAAHHVGLVRMDAGELGLEEVFVELVGGERP